MTSPTPNPNQSNPDASTVEQWIAQYLDGTIAATELQLLESELESNPYSRKLLRDAANIEEGLADWALVETETETKADASQTAVKNPSMRQASSKPLGSLSRMGWLAVAASLVLGLFVADMLDVFQSSPDPLKWSVAAPGLVTNSDVIDAEEHNYVAHVFDRADAKFDGLPFDDISDLQTGDYSLLQGYVHLRFKNGATMLLSAPAKFGIENENCFRLYDGQLRALVPRSSKEFCVSSPGVDFHDSGSEFGIRANAGECRSEINVFQGQVRSEVSGSDQVVRALVSGQAAVYRNGIVEFGEADAADFIEPGAIGFKRWQSNYVRLQNEPELIGYFPFIQLEPGVITNLVQHDELCEFEKMPDGRIGSATWVTGRWPGKRAMMFEGDQDHVDFDLPGQYEELTIATWVKLDRVSRPFNAIFNSNGWTPGSVHFQLNRFRAPMVTTFKAHKRDSSGKVPLGEWLHLAATVSKKTMKGYTYLNGQQIGTTYLPEGTIIRPGECRLGNWLDPRFPKASRGISGRIDELMIWKKSLSPAKIGELYAEGLPKTDLNFVTTASN